MGASTQVGCGVQVFGGSAPPCPLPVACALVPPAGYFDRRARTRGAVELNYRRVAVRACPEQEEAVEEVEAKTGASDLAVGFNVKYLLDSLNALQGEEVILCLRDANSSCLLRAPDSEQALHVIMPLRL